MKFSLWPNSSYTADEQLELARFADRNGYFGLWFADHYMPNTGDTSFAPGDYLECWGLIPAAAAITDIVRIGPLVSPTTVHHPAVLANRAATIDRVSNGRMVLGLGAGWQINEHHAYGIALDEPGPRVTRFGESIQIIRTLLHDDRTTFAGDYYTITDAPCDPKPVQQPLPILVGTKSPRMLGFTARYADEWNTWGTPDSAATNRGSLIDACERAAVDPATKHCSVNALIVLTNDEARAETERSSGRPTIAGSVEHLVDQLGRYANAGFDEFIWPFWNQGESIVERQEHLAQITTEVFGQLADTTP